MKSNSIKEVANDIWYIIAEFLPSARELNSLNLLNKDVNHQVTKSNLLWRNLFLFKFGFIPKNCENYKLRFRKQLEYYRQVKEVRFLLKAKQKIITSFTEPKLIQIFEKLEDIDKEIKTAASEKSYEPLNYENNEKILNEINNLLLELQFGKEKNRLYIKNITRLSESVLEKYREDLKQIKVLKLGGNLLIQLPKNFNYFEKLETLDISNNAFKKVPEIIFTMQNIAFFYISANKIRDIPDKIANLKKIKVFYAGRNKITDIPENLSIIDGLKILDINGNKLKRFPSVILRCNNLKSLNISDNKIYEIPFTLKNLTKLKVLKIFNCGIQKLPDSIFNMKKLSYLDLGNNKIRFLSDNIDKLTKLKYLKLDNCELTEFPKLCGLKNLMILDLSENKISFFPKEITQLTELNHLFIKENSKFDGLEKEFLKGISYVDIDIEKVLCNNRHKIK